MGDGAARDTGGVEAGWPGIVGAIVFAIVSLLLIATLPSTSGGRASARGTVGARP